MRFQRLELVFYSKLKRSYYWRAKFIAFGYTQQVYMVQTVIQLEISSLGHENSGVLE